MAVTLINGVEYGHTQVRVGIAGVVTPGVTAIKYKRSQVKENFVGSNGSRPVGRGYGEETFEASIKMSMVDLERLREVAPDGDITKIPPFPISVTFLNTQNKVVNHVLLGVEFMSDSTETETGTNRIETEIDLILSDIKFK